MDKTKINLVTAFFDINRKKVDGRTTEEYSTQLRTLLDCFPSTTLITDPISLAQLEIDHANIIYAEKEHLWPFDYRDPVKEIISGLRYRESSDITHKLPDYSLINISKLPMLKLALERLGGSTAVWLDAGLSRFFSAPQAIQQVLVQSINELATQGFEAGFEIETRGNTSMISRRIRNATPGSCRRIVSGSMFFASGAYLSELEYQAKVEMKDWIAGGLWDNDQVLLRRIIPRIEMNAFFHRQVGKPGSLLRRLMIQDPVSRSELQFSHHVANSFSKDL